MTGQPLKSLKNIFGYDTYRPQQREIIEGLIQGEDAFVLMPTGGGKSLCYQIPALHRPGVGIVVSPLISLMKDQVDALQACGVQAAYYNSSLKSGEARRVLAMLHAGELDLLYIAPERLIGEDFIVFSDVALAGMAAELPRDDEAFLNIHGVGAHKLERYGEQFLAEIREYLREAEGREP